MSDMAPGERTVVEVTGGVTGHVQVGSGNQIITAQVVVADAGGLLGSPDTVGLAGPLVGLPRLGSRVFVGRDELLTKLDLPVGATWVVTQAVQGLGGIGKTELVLHYCHTNRDGFPVLWWVTADSPQAIETGLAGLTAAVAASANRVGPQVVGDAARWAVGLLAAHPGWLVVLDNVEDQADVQEWLGLLSGGRVLVTTRRDTGWEDLADTLIRLDVLDHAAAVDLLTSRAGTDDPVAGDLAVELGCLPLALVQAAGYIRQTRTAMADYLARLRSRPAQTLAAGAPGGPAGQTVARVWQVTLDAIGASDPVAVEVLRVLACLAPDNIPRTLLAGLGDGVDGALGLLASYSMVTLTEQSVQVHRLVQAVVADQAHAAGTLAGSLRQALQLLDRARPADDPRTSTRDWPTWAVLVPHAQALADRWPTDDPDTNLANLLARMSAYLFTQGVTSTKVAVEERTLAIRQVILGPDHHATLGGRNNLAVAYWSVGRYDEAITLNEQNLADCIRVLGPDHPDTLASRSALAVAYWSVGRYAEAVTLHEQALADYSRVLGPDHPDTLRSRHNLANGYRSVGRYAEAVTLHEQALADRVRVLGPDHPNTVISRSALATGYRSVGRHAEAITLNEQALADCTRVLGPDHPDTLTSRNNLANGYWVVGRYAEAVTLFEQALADRVRILGPDHPDTLQSRSNLADARRQLEDRKL